MSNALTKGRPAMAVLPGELYARSQGIQAGGPLQCHWCAAPCRDVWRHDDPPPAMFERWRSSARRPNNPFICSGCWAFRRGRATVRFAGGGMADGRDCRAESWLVTEEQARALRPDNPGDASALLEQLLHPPLRFALALAGGTSPRNDLHLFAVNDLETIKADTPLWWTLAGARYEYTVYELEHAVKHGTDGLPGGVRELVRASGVCNAGPAALITMSTEPAAAERFTGKTDPDSEGGPKGGGGKRSGKGRGVATNPDGRVVTRRVR